MRARRGIVQPARLYSVLIQSGFLVDHCALATFGRCDCPAIYNSVIPVTVIRAEANGQTTMTTPRAGHREPLDQLLSVRFRRPVFDQINAAARRNDQSIGEWTRTVLRAALKREAAKSTPKRAA